MPKVWTDTVESHRAAVRGAILDATGRLVAADGLMSVTMSDVAEAAGIGRATLYKYFSGVEPLLIAWHERTVHEHVSELEKIRDGTGEPIARLTSVLEAYAAKSRGPHGSHLAAVLHQDQHVAVAQGQLKRLLSELLAEGVAAGQIRADVPPRELASYCLNALAAAADASSRAAVRRLVTVTVDGISTAT